MTCSKAAYSITLLVLAIPVPYQLSVLWIKQHVTSQDKEPTESELAPPYGTHAPVLTKMSAHAGQTVKTQDQENTIFILGGQTCLPNFYNLLFAIDYSDVRVPGEGVLTNMCTASRMFGEVTFQPHSDKVTFKLCQHFARPLVLWFGLCASTKLMPHVMSLENKLCRKLYLYKRKRFFKCNLTTNHCEMHLPTAN